MRQRKDFQRIEGVKSSRLIVIAAEGRATENIYFEAMRQELCATNVQLVVLNRDDDNSNPANVHRQIKEFMEEYNILDDDQQENCWMGSVCDGMGGHTHGEVASQLVVDVITTYWKNHLAEPDTLEKAIDKLIELCTKLSQDK